MLSQEVKDIVNATLPAVKAHAEDITGVFYPLMFDRYPQVKAYFNQAHQAQGTQRQALANAVVAYASNLDRLEVLGDAVSLIVQKHTSLEILPEHYPIVGECLLAAIKEVLGDAATDEIIAAWGETYQQLADILIGAEEAVYKTNEEKVGGWRGGREFVLTRKEVESDVITSFYFEPADGGAVADFSAGQYTCIVLSVDGQMVRRNYSLSNAPGQAYYRLSVKREPGGVVSNYLHDKLQVGQSVELAAPVGDFVLSDQNRPLVLLTAGVGITPAISMLEPALATGRSVQFIHAALNGASHAFKAYVDDLVEHFENLSVSYCYSAPLAGEQVDVDGFIDTEVLRRLIPNPELVDFYFLGPKPFMQLSLNAARALGVPAEQVRYEFFGPLQALEVETVEGAEA